MLGDSLLFLLDVYSSGSLIQTCVILELCDHPMLVSVLATTYLPAFRVLILWVAAWID